MSKNTRNRILLTAVAALLLVVMTVGGTLAWLTDSTEQVTNTFSPSDIHISLEESVDDDLQLIPGKEYEKIPVVAVDDEHTSVDIYLFVEFIESEGSKNYLTYNSTLTEANGWKLVDGEDNVWYREVADDAEVQSWTLLGDYTNATTNEKYQVKVIEDLTADDTHNTTVTLTYKAYAIQKDGFANAKAAWDQIATLAGSDDTTHTTH